MSLKLPAAATSAIAMVTGFNWRAFLVGLGVGAAALIAGYEFHARHLDAKLVKAHQTITADSSAHVVQMAKTDTLRAAAAHDAAASVRVDTLWRQAKASALATVPAIVNSPAPDTVKIQELVHVVDTLIVRGDSLGAANVLLVADVRGLNVQIDSERVSSARVIADEATALRISESEHAHVGFGCSAGPTVIVYPTPRAGAGITCGLTYRR